MDFWGNLGIYPITREGSWLLLSPDEDILVLF